MLEFKSFAGNNYAWDDEVGLFIPFPPTIKAVLRELSDTNPPLKGEVIEKLSGAFKEEDIAFYYDWIQKWKRTMLQGGALPEDNSDVDLSVSNIKTHLLRHGLKQLTLSVTEDCNFKCKYCIYHGNYEYSNRANSRNYMNFAIAKKAIDYYFSLLEEGRRYNPIRKPNISFYGGEPLLNFDLIKKCVEYMDNAYNTFEKHYNLTTNGSILDDDKADWLIKNGFSIMVSLDGPEDEHDRNRVYRNGKGTFKDVMKNITKLNSRMNRKVTSISIFDCKCDLFKREEFFSRPEIPPLNFLNQVSDVPGCNYYDQFSEDDFLAFAEQMKKAKVHYLEDIHNQRQKGRKTSVLNHLFGLGSLRAVHEISPILPPSPLMPFTGACIPGMKLFVDVKGNYHVCERVNETNPLGNVDEGLDFMKIREFVLDYLRHMDGCSSCKFRRSCSKCYSYFMNGTGFLYSSEVCKGIETPMLDDFSMAFTIGEMDSSYVDNIADVKLLQDE